MPQLPSQYSWLNNEGAPKMIVEALKLYGVKEVIGSGDNPEILSWAKELNIHDYNSDAIPWCGLAMAIIAHRAGKPVVDHPLWAQNWLNFGLRVAQALFGDILIFKRPQGGHVGLYIGESSDSYFVLGGNQSDVFGIARILKARCIGIRRPKYNVQPVNVRKILLTSEGEISTNES